MATSTVNISEEELPYLSDPACIRGGGGPSASWEMSPLWSSHWYRPDHGDHSHPGGDDNYNERHPTVSRAPHISPHNTVARCMGVKCVYLILGNNISPFEVISSPIIIVHHPMYHHYPWSVWRVSPVSPKTHYEWITASPSRVNLRHNNCLTERALQHCTCLVSPPILPSTASDFTLDAFTPHQIHIKLCFQLRWLGHGKLDNWWIRKMFELFE